ncbi:hypothetical protein [Bradyrhizobium sp. 174]|uniref:hypothetical protein n=1 Tax=Bradyrhizobium sp. 174 TaxID=2782645 RepID=UPI001FF86AAF|nr:hypothetical protein [Bradyrhizobium sp. 174]MCK1577772.1 hypothetical protein [Bradyrhizobium sp. 174]
MDPATILADVQIALQVGKMAYDLGKESAPFLIKAYQIAFENKVLTAEERAALKAQEDAYRAEIAAAVAADAAAAD